MLSLACFRMCASVERFIGLCAGTVILEFQQGYVFGVECDFLSAL